jgi:thiamine kinase-like enzyme
LTALTGWLIMRSHHRRGVKADGMDAVPSVDDILGRVALFSGRARSHQPIEGGLSHHIWVVTCGSRSYILRVLDPAVSDAGLGVPAAQEIANTLRAAESGVGARVFEVLPEIPALVLEFLPGRTLGAADVRQSSVLRRVAGACRRLHAGPRFDNEFSIVAKLHELLDICHRHELTIPDGYLDRLTIVDRVAEALAVVPVSTVPCHNDLLAENFIDSGGVIRIVDYQLSGNNDPSFELGDIAAESDYDPDRTDELAAAYFGDELTPALAARVRLNLMLSNVTWTLWFSVHHGLLRRPHSSFDYWTEASDKWRQATRDLDSPELGRLLDLVAGRSTSTHP